MWENLRNQSEIGGGGHEAERGEASRAIWDGGGDPK